VYSTIVVGTDGSETASEAVKAAADLARRTGAVLHLLSAFSTTTGMMGVPTAGFVAGDGPDSDALAQEAEEVLTNADKGLEGITVEHHTVGGAPADALVSIAEQVQADLIVVGNKGMHRRILGSIPNSVAHNAPCTVLIVKTT
jgi:nucleotide-binding universal stress UspA family protein